VRAVTIDTRNNLVIGDFPIDLAWLQEQVGGHIEAVHIISPGVVMYINNEGGVRHLLPNLIATALYRDLICGDVVICGYDEEGDDVDIPESAIQEIFKKVRARSNA